MPRTNKILIRSGTVAPTASDFAVGEPAFDKSAGKFYVKNAAGSMVEIGAGGGGGATEVYEYATTASFPATGAAATLYIATDYGRVYRWVDSTTKYVEVGAISSYDSRWDLFLPSAPTGVTGTAGNQQVALTWTAPTVSAQTPITSYTVQYSSNGGSTWTTWGTSPTTNSATITSLTNGTAYTFRVLATNAVGSSAYSSASSSVTPFSFTAIPVMTSATAPAGTVSDSGVLSGGTPSWHCFNKATVSGDTTFYGSPAPASGNWIQYDFGYSTSASGYQITSRQLSPYGSTQAPPSWTLSGSANGSSFTVIDTRTSQTWNANGEQKSFSLSSVQTYRYWRWTWTSSPPESAVVIPKIQLTG